MKILSKLFVLISIFPFLSGCQTVNSSFSANSFDTTDTNNLDSEEPFSDIDILERQLPVFYYNVIDPFSDKQFNYKAPYDATAQFRRIDSYKSLFEGEECYKLLSLFDNVPLQYVINYSETFNSQQLFVDLRQGIKIAVKYTDFEDNKITRYFQISKEGRLGFLTAEQSILFYTDSNAISYESVETRIKELDDYYHKNNRPLFKHNKNTNSSIQYRTYYVLTPNKSGVTVIYYGEMSQVEIEECNQAGDELVPEATRIADSSAVYNCHSYAWYQRSISNYRWIGDVSPYINDGTYEEITLFGDVEIGDIICYFDSNDQNKHSGVVIAKTEGASNNVCGNSDLVTVCSKWGEWGLYEHQGDQCPYTSTYGGDAIYVKYYRVHFNESFLLSNPSQNTPEIINRSDYVDEYISYGQTSHYAMFELNINYIKTYSFEITGDYYLEVNLFKGPMQEVSINNATVYENGVYKVAFNYFAQPEKYYLRVTYENSSCSGTIYTQITNTHVHSYTDSYFWYDYTKHQSRCICNGSIFGPHVVSASMFFRGNQYATCLLCFGPASFGVLPLSLNNLPTSHNGSVILPNGVIVLVDEDIQSYLNGTLVFSNPNSN